MLRRFLDYSLSLTQKDKRFAKARPLVDALDTFLYEAPCDTKRAPHIRDAIDVKRWMLIVVIALIPCLLFGIWNSGLQSFVYGSGDFRIMNEYLRESPGWNGYWHFVFKDDRYLTIIALGLKAVIPLIIISYAVGGFWEALFAMVRGHEISEGFLVTGLLYALILPATIPYWMAAVGISAGVILAKEVFGGSGMNIVNPALASRAFLFFTFPGKMSGEVWAGTNPTYIRESLLKMNHDAKTGSLDAYTQATKLAQFNINPEIKRIHIDAIASNNLGSNVGTYPALEHHFNIWSHTANSNEVLGSLSEETLKKFVTSPISEGGLALSSGYYEDAYRFAGLQYGIGQHNNDWSFFMGDKLGSIGETSIFACILGAVFLIYTGVGSWRIMLSMLLGAYLTALGFEYGTHFFGAESGAWNPASLAFPAYKHLILGGFAFGTVFMATDPVSAPSMRLAKWIYGFFCGAITIVIRTINPAYPEGVMLAILMGNVFAPLFDFYATRHFMKKGKRYVKAA